jgi:hypothetical protein
MARAQPVRQSTAAPLTIWFGWRGSDNRFEGLISYDGDSIVGAWTWPGGGYRATMTRIDADG